MKSWLKENWFRIGLLTILAISVAGAFYWYGIRPSIIKKDCYNNAKEKAIEKQGGSTALGRLANDGKFTKDDYDTYYRWCLEKYGL